jgi:hypothetical protein
MKAHWQTPKILAMDEAGRGLGDCFAGTTATDTTCKNGQNTAFDVLQDPPHGCFNGGAASTEYGGCSTGSTVITPA